MWRADHHLPKSPAIWWGFLLLIKLLMARGVKCAFVQTTLINQKKTYYNATQVSTIVLYQVLLTDKTCVFMLRKIL
ncbi:hypothetical protein AAX09_00290 [Moraxella bovoculi]|nr:hypothetical protein AAX09_00290 [Moraxella bovoculi]